MALPTKVVRKPAKETRPPFRARSRPGEDKPVDDQGLTVIRVVRECKRESDDARRSRLHRNKKNMDAYMGIQDFSDKIEGQSTEFLPKISMAAEQLSAFVKRALTQFGQWFHYEHGKHIKGRIPLSEKQIETIIKYYLDDLPNEEGNGSTTIATQMGDAIKTGALESLIIFKVYGAVHTERAFHVELGGSFELKDRGDGTFEVPEGLPLGGIEPELVVSEKERWRLHADLIKPEDYYPDPSGKGLYEIHTVERDLAYVQEMADKGVYDKAAVSALTKSVDRKEEDKRRARHMGQDESKAPGFRKKVVLDEFWGDLIGSNGRIVKKNVTCTVANDMFLIRKPTDNPFWHGERPFVVAPLIRVPWSVWHKALYDSASELNFTLNEIFNLILDGGLASVWGIKQLRAGYLENPEQVSGGIPQGKTLVVDDNLPANVKVLEDVTTGKIPPEAGALLQLLDREFLTAALSNELRAGMFPGRRVLATEITEIQQSQALTLDSISSDLENEIITEIIRKGWLCILQDISVLDEAELTAQIGERAAVWLMETAPEERFAIFARHGKFKVNGLSAVLTKARDFQKLAGLLQLAMSNPVLLQSFVRRVSADKILDAAIKMLNLNPEDLQKDEEELANAGLEMQLALMLGAGKGRGSSGPNAEMSGDASMPAEINQAANPLTGMSAS